MTTREQTATTDPSVRTQKDRHIEDLIDESLEESFPASDPPARDAEARSGRPGFPQAGQAGNERPMSDQAPSMLQHAAGSNDQAGA